MKVQLAVVAIALFGAFTVSAAPRDYARVAATATQPAQVLREALTEIGEAKSLSFQVHGARSKTPAAEYANEMVFGSHQERWLKVQYQRPGRISIVNAAAGQYRAIFNDGMLYMVGGDTRLGSADATPWRTVEQILEQSPNGERLFQMSEPTFQWLLIARPWEDYVTFSRDIRYAGQVRLNDEMVDRIEVIDVEGRQGEFWLTTEPPRRLRRIIRESVETQTYLPISALNVHGGLPPHRAEVPIREEWTFTRWNFAAEIDPTAFDRPPEVKVETREKATMSGPPVGAVAPDFTLQDLQGNTVTLKSLLGKTIVLDFWTQECPPCVRRLRHSRDVASRYAGRNVVLVSIESDQSAAKLRAFVDKMDWNDLTVLVDSQKKMWDAYRIHGMSQVLVVGPDGKVVYNEAGNLGQGLVNARMTRLLDELATKN